MTPSLRAAVLVLVSGAGLGACAMKSDVQQVQTDLALFKAESGRRDSARAAQLAEVIHVQQVILDSLRSSGRVVGRLKGDLSTDLYNIQQQLAQLQALTGQSQSRLSALQQQLEARKAEMQATQPTDTAAAPAATASASEMYEASLKQLQRGSASTARLGLQEMLRVYPSSERAPDALYFIGQTFTLDHPDSAAAYYQQVVDRYPTSTRAATALYNLGVLAERAKDNTKARQVYQQVVDKYKDSPEADLASDKLRTLPKR